MPLRRSNSYTRLRPGQGPTTTPADANGAAPSGRYELRPRPRPAPTGNDGAINTPNADNINGANTTVTPARDQDQPSSSTDSILTVTVEIPVADGHPNFSRTANGTPSSGPITILTAALASIVPRAEDRIRLARALRSLRDQNIGDLVCDSLIRLAEERRRQGLLRDHAIRSHIMNDRLMRSRIRNREQNLGQLRPDQHRPFPPQAPISTTPNRTQNPPRAPPQTQGLFPQISDAIAPVQRESRRFRELIDRLRASTPPRVRRRYASTLPGLAEQLQVLVDPYGEVGRSVLGPMPQPRRNARLRRAGNTAGTRAGVRNITGTTGTGPRTPVQNGTATAMPPPSGPSQTTVPTSELFRDPSLPPPTRRTAELMARWQQEAEDRLRQEMFGSSRGGLARNVNASATTSAHTNADTTTAHPAPVQGPQTHGQGQGQTQGQTQGQGQGASQLWHELPMPQTDNLQPENPRATPIRAHTRARVPPGTRRRVNISQNRANRSAQPQARTQDQSGYTNTAASAAPSPTPADNTGFTPVLCGGSAPSWYRNISYNENDEDDDDTNSADATSDSDEYLESTESCADSGEDDSSSDDYMLSSDDEEPDQENPDPHGSAGGRNPITVHIQHHNGNVYYRPAADGDTLSTAETLVENPDSNPSGPTRNFFIQDSNPVRDRTFVPLHPYYIVTPIPNPEPGQFEFAVVHQVPRRDPRIISPFNAPPRGPTICSDERGPEAQETTYTVYRNMTPQPGDLDIIVVQEWVENGTTMRRTVHGLMIDDIDFPEDDDDFDYDDFNYDDLYDKAYMFRNELRLPLPPRVPLPTMQPDPQPPRPQQGQPAGPFELPGSPVIQGLENIPQPGHVLTATTPSISGASNHNYINNNVPLNISESDLISKPEPGASPAQISVHRAAAPTPGPGRNLTVTPTGTGGLVVNICQARNVYVFNGACQGRVDENAGGNADGSEDGNRRDCA